MKKLLSLFISILLTTNITAYAISDTAIAEYRKTKSQEYSEQLKDSKTESGELFIDLINTDKILLWYFFHNNIDDLFTTYNGSNFADSIYEVPFGCIAEQKDGHSVFCSSSSGKAYTVDMSDEFGGYFDDEKLAECLSLAGVTSITDMKISNVDWYGSPYFLYVNTDKGEFIVLGEDFSDKLLPDKKLSAFKAYTADEFVNFCREMIKAHGEELDQKNQEELEKSGLIDVDENGDLIIITPKPTTTPKPSATPQPTETAKPTVEPTTTPVPEVLTVESGDEITVKVNDKAVMFPDAKPFLDDNGRTQVPVRAVSEMLNAKVDWQQDSATAVITKDNGDTVKITLNSNVMTINEKSVQMDTAATLKDDRTFIPVRFVAEALGLTVNWVE